jgi:predicted SnoaL-like aldol condensation-catalyzing enzyme
MQLSNVQKQQFAAFGAKYGHGRPKSWIAADILRIVDGVLVEHWDVVLQDEATRAESKSGLPMFGSSVIA